MFDALELKKQFPIFSNHPDLTYLDNAATMQKPRCVLDAERFFYENHNANVHRGAHRLASAATDAYEGARQIVANFINAPSHEEIIFTRGTTEAINLVANTWGSTLSAGDEIILSALEHHANIVPWQMLAQRTGAVLKIIQLDQYGTVDLEHFSSLLSDKTKLVAISHVSNAIGSIQPIAWMCNAAHHAGAKVLVDGAQAVAHLEIDVQALGIDFYVFSGHKAYAPTGIGVLWVENNTLQKMPPWQGGGEMIASVSFSGSTYAAAPYRFEAGTPAIAQAVGLGAALTWLSGLDRSALLAHEHQLRQQLETGLAQIAGITIHGQSPNKAALTSMTFTTAHPYDVAQFLDHRGIAVRVGHHCAQPLLHTLGISGTLRASFAAYNTSQDVEYFLAVLTDTLEILS
ncbi:MULTISPECIES: cysteine desulfurase [Deefgea]|uniref:Cysteine desulfurase n=1 Tax=Deefgea chitinilytica TaxID=570276 RepID=A0ABS2CBM3_9NEIS|nr:MULTISPECIES: cysteine desulfurase [Deefgea]MBM5570833.1 SufS family cysteine desulfurase [Deefgea chitinilytica]MBM9888062.1 cysteine desulfurase [Deefgea sp. CFH1-16]